MVEITALILGTGVGLVLGLTGAGGSVIAVPLLIFGLGWTLPQAVPVALLAVAVSALVGAVAATRQGLVCYRAAVVLALLGFLTAPVGIWLSLRVTDFWLQLVFAAVLLIVAVRLFIQATYSPDDSRIVRAAITRQESNPVCRLNPETGKLTWTSPCAFVLALGGAATGLISGLIGVGGGFIIVPAIRHLTQLSMHTAVGTSLLVITLISIAGFVSALFHDVPVSWATGAPFVAGAVLGMIAGRTLAPILAGPQLQKGFAVLMVVVSAGLLVKIL